MTSLPPLRHLADAGTIDLGQPSPKPTSLTGQSEVALEIHSRAGALDVGVWECEPGEFTAAHDDDTEICQILSGSATVIGDDGATAEIHAGSLLVLPVGWHGRWKVHQAIRKAFIVVSEPSGQL